MLGRYERRRTSAVGCGHDLPAQVVASLEERALTPGLEAVELARVVRGSATLHVELAHPVLLHELQDLRLRQLEELEFARNSTRVSLDLAAVGHHFERPAVAGGRGRNG